MAPSDLRCMMIFSAVLRLLLIVYGEWQDSHMEVRYTDIDYFVFSNAADLVSKGKSPFERSTYRYSPMLAFLLVPNSVLHRSWGKLLFSAAGDHCTVLCVVLLPSAPGSSLEQYEAKMERSDLRLSVDGISSSLACVGLSTRIQGAERLPAVVVGKPDVLGCKHLGSTCDY